MSLTRPSSSRKKDVEHSIYEVPLILQRERSSMISVRKYLHLKSPGGHEPWQDIIRKLIAPQHRVRIGVVGKYIEPRTPQSVYEAVIHGGVANDCGVRDRSNRVRGN
jgi:CTP synthase